MDIDDRTDEERNLGFGYGTGDEYLTGNDDDSPDSPEVLNEDTTLEPLDLDPDLVDDPGPPGAGDSQVGLGEGTGTEAFDRDPRGARGRPHDQAELGDADFRTQEAVYQQYVERQDQS